jgi:hypothetical protein
MIYAMNDDPCTEIDIERIRLAAKERQHYVMWLAGYLERSDDELLRKSAAKELRQLVGGVDE